MYDTETFLRDLETVYKANLNTRIAAINAEKADFNINNINANAWYFQNMNSDIFSYDEFIVWGLSKPPDVEVFQNDNYLKIVKVFIEVVIPDAGETSTENIIWKLLRYTRALEEVAFKNFDKFQGVAKTSVESLLPTSFELDGKMFRSSGISISAAMSAY